MQLFLVISMVLSAVNCEWKLIVIVIIVVCCLPFCMALLGVVLFVNFMESPVYLQI